MFQCRLHYLHVIMEELPPVSGKNSVPDEDMSETKFRNF